MPGIPPGSAAPTNGFAPGSTSSTGRATTWGATYLDRTVVAPEDLVALATFPYLLASLVVRLAGDGLVCVTAGDLGGQPPQLGGGIGGGGGQRRHRGGG